MTPPRRQSLILWRSRVNNLQSWEANRRAGSKGTSISYNVNKETETLRGSLVWPGLCRTVRDPARNLNPGCLNPNSWFQNMEVRVAKSVDLGVTRTCVQILGRAPH